ncbi:MAG: helix-hairpin-helix domain-containing protein [Armatimonadetes bacterium]|nr:helix-hairpin-helix domain-containing protein [Armatimonadota bacterium]
MSERAKALQTIPNVGPAIARDLLKIGIEEPDDLKGRDPDELFHRLCALDGRRHDPCVRDVFAAAVSFANGEPARPWWEFSRERKARERRE